MSETPEVGFPTGNTGEDEPQTGLTVSKDTLDPATSVPVRPTFEDARGVERIAGPPVTDWTPAPVEPSEDQVRRMDEHNAREEERRQQRLSASLYGDDATTDVTPADPGVPTGDPADPAAPPAGDPTAPVTPAVPATSQTQVETDAAAAADADVEAQVEAARAAASEQAAQTADQTLRDAEAAEVTSEEQS